MSKTDIIKKVFLFCILIHFCFYGWSQKNLNTDSLIRTYNKQKTVNKKLNILYQISNIKYTNSEKSFIENKLEFLKSNLQTYNDSGLYLYIKGNLISNNTDNNNSLIIFINSLHFFEKDKCKSELEGKLCSQIAHIYLYKGNRDSSLFYYKKALDFYQINKIVKHLPQAYYDLGLECYVASKVTPALENCFKSIKTGISQNNYYYVALSYRLLSKISRDQNTNLKFSYIDSAIYYAEKSKDSYAMEYVYFQKGEYLIDEKKYEEGYTCAKKIEAIYKKDSLNHWIKSDYNEFLARYYEAIGDYNNCIKFYKKTIAINLKYSDYSGKIGWMYNNMGDVCIQTDRFKEAIQYFDSAITYSEKFNDLNLKWYAFYNITYAYKGINDYKTALDYFFKYNAINDSILKKENGEKLASLQANYELENKEIQIANLLKENIFKQDRIDKENFEKRLLIFLIALCFIIIFLSVLGFIVKHRDNKKLSFQKQEIINNSELLKKQATEIAKFKSQMNPHFIFNALNSMQHLVINNETEIALNYLNNVSSIIRKALDFSDKDQIMLKEELEFLSKYVQIEQLRCNNLFDFKIKLSPHIDTENTKIPPMLIQPFIENSIKHGIIPKKQFGNIELNITKCNIDKSEMLKITILDTGVGICSKNSLNDNHVSKGTEITHNRLKKINEQLLFKNIDFLSVQNYTENDIIKGTKVEILIPLIEEF